jgi:hypothetical protein
MARHVGAALVLTEVIVTVMLIAGSVRNPSGPPRTGSGCVVKLGAGFRQAALRGRWADVFLTALDSELVFVDCARRAMIGR